MKDFHSDTYLWHFVPMKAAGREQHSQAFGFPYFLTLCSHFWHTVFVVPLLRIESKRPLNSTSTEAHYKQLTWLGTRFCNSCILRLSTMIHLDKTVMIQTMEKKNNQIKICVFDEAMNLRFYFEGHTLHSWLPLDSDSKGWREKHFEQANKRLIITIQILFYYIFAWYFYEK